MVCFLFYIVASNLASIFMQFCSLIFNNSKNKELILHVHKLYVKKRKSVTSVIINYDLTFNVI